MLSSATTARMMFAVESHRCPCQQAAAILGLRVTLNSQAYPNTHGQFSPAPLTEVLGLSYTSKACEAGMYAANYGSACTDCAIGTFDSRTDLASMIKYLSKGAQRASQAGIKCKGTITVLLLPSQHRHCQFSVRYHGRYRWFRNQWSNKVMSCSCKPGYYWDINRAGACYINQGGDRVIVLNPNTGDEMGCCSVCPDGGSRGGAEYLASAKLRVRAQASRGSSYIL